MSEEEISDQACNWAEQQIVAGTSCNREDIDFLLETGFFNGALWMLEELNKNK